MSELISSKDKDNFEIKVGEWTIIMIDGELEINGCSYEENEDDPTYDLARELWRLSK